MSNSKPMNMLVITSDQHNRHMLGCYGNTHIKTPNLDKLAKQGVTFENAYCNSPLCVPSRASMATGNYASAGSYWDNAHAFKGDQPSWGTRLSEQGYSVTTIGKLHFAGNMPETGFPEQIIPINIKNGIGDVYGAIRDKEITRLQFREALNQAGAGESDYIGYDRAIARQAVAYLQAAKHKTKRPFALYVSFVTPHFPLIVPAQYLNLYPDEHSVETPVQFHKSDWPHHPVLDDYRRYCGTADIDDKTGYQALRTYYALCTFMDEQVGIVLDALKENGLDDNTRIIYSSDHGDTMGEHGLYFKSTMYEGSNGVPLIVKGPDLPSGKRNKTNVSLVDLYPTIIDCVGAEKAAEDEHLPGISLWPLAKGQELPERVVFSEYYSFGSYTSVFMLKKGAYKYIHYVGERPQLFNLETDPGEQSDLANLPQYQEKVAEMAEELSRIVDAEEMDSRARTAQEQLLQSQGGKEKIIRETNPSLFSPVPVT